MPAPSVRFCNWFGNHCLVAPDFSIWQFPVIHLAHYNLVINDWSDDPSRFYGDQRRSEWDGRRRNKMRLASAAKFKPRLWRWWWCVVEKSKRKEEYGGWNRPPREGRGTVTRVRRIRRRKEKSLAERRHCFPSLRTFLHDKPMTTATGKLRDRYNHVSQFLFALWPNIEQ